MLPVKVYRYADLALHSSLDLPEIPETPDLSGHPEPIMFLVRDPEPPGPEPERWLHLSHASHEKPLVSLARTAEGFLLRFPSYADFLVDHACSRVECRPEPSCSVESVRHLLLDQVLPRVLAQRGRLVLHAGAVEVGGGAAVLTGASGAGKSTMVASLHDSGYTALTDDGLVIEEDPTRCSVLALYSSLRLWPSALTALDGGASPSSPMAGYSQKRRRVISQTASIGWRPLRAIFVLSEAPKADNVRSVTVSRLSARDACVELIRSSFQLDLEDHRNATDMLQRTARIADRLPVLRLDFPRDFDRLPEVRNSILRHLDHDGDGVSSPSASSE
jgi:hypothetical protein